MKCIYRVATYSPRPSRCWDRNTDDPQCSQDTRPGYLRFSAVDPLDTKQSRQSCVESVLVCRDNLYCALPQPQPRSSPLPGFRRRI
ncbi:hypothetical protein BN1708_004576 [Verticillium longisporum]|uniref:Uncharacterized protein n=1 Tax=Verticillium longisporum TaxID=100787 RepID=A0A0G4M2R6_VERLO|nr:hypothetical protein BN1708_004576 [Verticillium longisporum]